VLLKEQVTLALSWCSSLPPIARGNERLLQVRITKNIEDAWRYWYAGDTKGVINPLTQLALLEVFLKSPEPRQTPILERRLTPVVYFDSEASRHYE
jgi:hypothetical protein